MAGAESRPELLTLCVLCPQEPDQVYEGITFDDFLKVGVWEETEGVGA